MWLSEWVDTEPGENGHAHKDLVVFEQLLDLVPPQLHVEFNLVEAGYLATVGGARSSLNAVARVLRPPKRLQGLPRGRGLPLRLLKPPEQLLRPHGHPGRLGGVVNPDDEVLDLVAPLEDVAAAHVQPIVEVHELLHAMSPHVFGVLVRLFPREGLALAQETHTRH